MNQFANKSRWEANAIPARADNMFRSNRYAEVTAPDYICQKLETPHRIRTPHSSDDRAVDASPSSRAFDFFETPTCKDDKQDDIDNVICFGPGTGILTGQGERAIETLQRGDLVMTRDQGLRPIRWIGTRVVQGTGTMAPVEISTTTQDGDAGLLVSPHHRMLFTGHRAEMLFGVSEVLVPAVHLVDGMAIRRCNVKELTYYHLMFDHHEVIYANGIATESFHATDTWLTGLEDQAREKLFGIFPNLRTSSGPHLEPVRQCLDDVKARLLLESERAEASYA